MLDAEALALEAGAAVQAVPLHETIADWKLPLPNGTGAPDRAWDGQRFVRMVQFNPAVQAGIRRWLTDMRPSLMDSYENYEYMRHLMWPHFEKAGLPEQLSWLPLVESGFKDRALSRARALESYLG